MRLRRFWILAAAACAALLPAAAPARADAVYTVASWEMNERPGSRVMHDDSGNGLYGTIGREVITGSGGFRFARLQPDTPPTHPRHLVVVPNAGELNPGDREFEISLRLRTVYHFGNIVQKGQATVAGGSYKLQIPSGKVQCWFRGSAGQVLVTAPRAINDGRWHLVTCTRYSDGVTLAIDGSRVASRWGATGRIANSWPLSIGGKTTCDQVTVGCDYFAGDLDYVRINAADHDW
ncbi:LamG-like jellyroll fold domain-containing protein [Actinoplanes sp. CA-030573]|uniref:LamG-like jellyroll fold domain-containing protein n=1 Tax=Actinoplanes sp. CA-030573 TaxID=3239898 RepID=UPI003D8E97FB